MTTRADPGQIACGVSRIAVGELAAFLKDNPKVQYLDCVFADLCGMIRGKRVPRADLESVFTAGIGIPFSIYFLDARGNAAPATQEPGAGTAWPVQGTLSKVAWSHLPHGQVLMTMVDSNSTPYLGEPRNVLKRVADRLALLDLVPLVSTTIEFYLLDREGTKNGIPAPPAITNYPQQHSVDPVEPLQVEGEFTDALSAMVEGAAPLHLPKIEFVQGATQGQFRVTLASNENILQAADQVVFLRQVVCAVARQFQLDATFMATPFLKLPGSAMKVQLQLQDHKGRNAFTQAENKLAGLLQFSLGGLQMTMPESVAIMAPNQNAYRRFGRRNGVACNRRWGIENDTTNIATRLTSTGEQAITHKMASADANPYLALASILSGVHHGISERLEPNLPHEGDALTFNDPTLPLNFDAALISFENGSILREYFQGDYVDRYCATKRSELERFSNFIPAHEYEWYL